MSAPEAIPVVLLHGLATNATRTWVDNGWVDILADAGRTAIAVDLPGHHRDSCAGKPSSYRGFEEQVLASLPTGRLDIVGFSLGARTAAILAARHPERVRRLVLMGVGENLFRDDGHGALLADALDDIRSDVTPEPPELAAVAHHFASLARSCGVSLEALVALLRRPDGRPLAPDDLTPITASTLILLGDRDPAGPAGPLLNAISGAVGRTLPNCDHFATVRSMTAIDAAVTHLTS